MLSVDEVNESQNSQGADLLECPYSSLHKVSSAKFGNHIFRCRRNYEKSLNAKGEEIQWLKCRWNSFHFIPPPELNFHEASCPDSTLSKWKVFEPVEVHNQVSHGTSKKHFEVEMAYEEENWEEEMQSDVKTEFKYPIIRENQLSMYNPTMLNKIEKKTWTAEQREKFRVVSATDPKWACSAPALPARAPIPSSPPNIKGAHQTWSPKPLNPRQICNRRNEVKIARQKSEEVETRRNWTGPAEPMRGKGLVRVLEERLPGARNEERGDLSGVGFPVVDDVQIGLLSFDSCSIVSGSESSVYMDAAGSSDVGILDWVKGEDETGTVDFHSRCAQSDESDDEFFDAKSSVDG